MNAYHPMNNLKLSMLFVFWAADTLPRHSSTALLILPATKPVNNRFISACAMSRDGYAHNYFPGPGQGYPDEDRYFDEPIEEPGDFSENAYRNYNYEGQSPEEFTRRNGGDGYVNGNGRGREDFYDEPFGQKGDQQQYREDDEDRWQDQYESPNYFDRNQRQPQQQYGANFGQQGQYGEDFEQRSFTDDDERQEKYFGQPQPPSGRPEHRSEYRGDLGRATGGDKYDYQGAGDYYDAPQPKFEKRRSEPPQYGSLTRRQRRDQLRQHLSNNPRGEPLGSADNERRMDRNMNPFMGFDRMDPMMGPRMNPYSDFGMMDRVVDEMMHRSGMMDRIYDRVSSEMAASMNQDQQPMDFLLADACDFLQANEEVTETLGEEFEFGRPFAHSSSSGTLNGVTRSRLQLGIPIRGGKSAGRLKISADDERITGLVVDTGSRLIDVDVGNQIREDSTAGSVGGDDAIEANVVDKKYVESKLIE